MKEKKYFKKVVSLLLAASTFCTISLFAGCKKEGDDSESQSAQNNQESVENKNPFAESVYPNVKLGTHINEVEPTDGFIVNNGQSNYKIVVNGAAYLWNAEQIQKYVKESTGCTLSIINEADVADYNDNSKYIFVGPNKFMDEANIDYTFEELGTNGFKIKSHGSSFFIGAYYKRGVDYAVFEFLHHLIGFEQYSTRYTYWEDKKTIPTFKMNIVELPDYEWRLNSNGSYGEMELAALRMNTIDDVWMVAYSTGGIKWIHNSFDYLPSSVYGYDHPNWYADTAAGAVQLCYTARGDQDEYNEMVDTAFVTLQDLVKTNPHLNSVNFSYQDVQKMCDCNACKAEKEKYGTVSAAYVKFVNALGKKLKTWIAESGEVDKNRKVTLYALAYWGGIEAPTKNIEELVFEENVGLWYAPIDLDWTNKFSDPENEKEFENFQRWSTLTDSLFLWLYQANFSNYLIPHPTWGTYQELYRYFYEQGARVMIHQGQFNNVGSTAFDQLKIYLSCKLAWNVNLDEKELTEDFFNHVYGPAAETMKIYFDELNANYFYFKDQELIRDLTDLYPYPVIKRWLQYFELAHSQLESVKVDNPDRYERQNMMIVMESIFPQYVNVEMYADYYSIDALNALRQAFINDVGTAAITRFSEPTDIGAIISKWKF